MRGWARPAREDSALGLAAARRWGVSLRDPPSTHLAWTSRSPFSPPFPKAPRCPTGLHPWISGIDLLALIRNKQANDSIPISFPP